MKLPCTELCVALVVAVGVASSASASALEWSADGQQVRVEPGRPLIEDDTITVEAWVQPFFPSRYSSIVSKQVSGTGFHLAAFPREGGEGLKFVFEARDTLHYAPPDPEALIGVWTHVAGVREDDDMRLYLNGELVASMTAEGPMTPNDNGVWIGSSPFGNDTNWRGPLEEIRIWTIARTQAQIRESMGLKLTGNEAGLKAYWRLDESEGDFIFDATGNMPPGRLGCAEGPDECDPAWVEGVDLVTACERADIDGSGDVGLADLLILLAQWGDCPQNCFGDMNMDGTVNWADLLRLLSIWGPCA